MLMTLRWLLSFKVTTMSQRYRLDSTEQKKLL